MNWLIRRILDAYRTLSKKVYARRYGTLARHMGREEIAPAQEEAIRRGFIIIQADGLAYDHLLQAIARGAAPYMKRLIGAGQLRLAPWRCGVPSTTPAVQAGIMFGNNWDIPGFRWFDKKQHRALVCKRPTTVQTLQKRVANGRRGILHGGSSYYNMFDGGAEWAVFTLSALRAPRFFEGMRGLGLALLFLLSPLRVLRVIRLAVWNYLIDMGRRLLAIFRPSIYRPLDVLSPMTHIFTHVLFQEIMTFGVQMDIYRGAPAIYLNNATYDEVAHKVGPTHSAAFKTVKDIDRQIARIDKMLRRYGQRPYDLYILSDHGMSPSVPFKQRFGQSLGDYIVQQIDEPLILDERWGDPGYAVVQAHYLMEELRGLEERLSPRSAKVMRAAREYLNRHTHWIDPGEDDAGNPIQPPALATEPPSARISAHLPLFRERRSAQINGRNVRSDRDRWDPQRQIDVAVRISGPLAHVYFNVSDQRLNLSEIALLYPTLLARLIEHPGIGLVVVRESEETVMMGRRGTLTVRRDLDRLRGSNPLDGLSDPYYQAAQLEHVASFPHAGDLILLGAWENDAVVTFEDQLGTHGGVGGPQEKPFILYPARVDWPSGAITSPCDLYPIFARYLDQVDSTAPDGLQLSDELESMVSGAETPPTIQDTHQTADPVRVETRGREEP